MTCITYDCHNLYCDKKISTVTMINDLWRQLWFKTLSLINVCKLICTCDRLCNLHLWPSKFMYFTRVVKCICDLYYWYAIVIVYLWLVTCLWLDLHLWYVLWFVFVTFLSYVCHMYYVTCVVKCICDLYYWYAILTMYLWLVTCFVIWIHYTCDLLIMFVTCIKVTWR